MPDDKKEARIGGKEGKVHVQKNILDTTDYIPNDAVAVPSGVTSTANPVRRNSSPGAAHAPDNHFVTLVLAFSEDPDPSSGQCDLTLDVCWAHVAFGGSESDLPDKYAVFSDLKTKRKHLTKGLVTLTVDLNQFDGKTFKRTQTDAILSITGTNSTSTVRKTVVVTLFQGKH